MPFGKLDGSAKDMSIPSGSLDPQTLVEAGWQTEWIGPTTHGMGRFTSRLIYMFKHLFGFHDIIFKKKS